MSVVSAPTNPPLDYSNVVFLNSDLCKTKQLFSHYSYANLFHCQIYVLYLPNSYINLLENLASQVIKT